MAKANLALLTIGIIATAAIAQNNAVTVGGAVATAAGNAVGFANTEAAIGERVPVTALGTALATAGAAIALGAAVEIGAAGKVVTKAAGITIGRSLSTASADGDQVEILIIPN